MCQAPGASLQPLTLEFLLPVNARGLLGGKRRSFGYSAEGGTVGDDCGNYEKVEYGNYDCGTSGQVLDRDPKTLGIHYRGVQWEGGAVDGGSIIW